MAGATATLARSSGRTSPALPRPGVRAPHSTRATADELEADTRRESLDTLCAHWRSALDAAQSALRAAGPMLPAPVVRERSVHLRLERTLVAHELEALARDRHVEASLSDLQMPAESLRRPVSRGTVRIWS